MKYQQQLIGVARKKAKLKPADNHLAEGTMRSMIKLKNKKSLFDGGTGAFDLILAMSAREDLRRGWTAMVALSNHAA